MEPAVFQDKDDVATAVEDAPSAEELAELIDCENVLFEHSLYERNAVVLGSMNFQFFAWYYLRRHLEYEIAPFQEELYSTLQTIRPGQNGLFLLPRGHGKSTVISFAYVLWHVCYRTKKHIGIVSSTSELAKKFLGKISSELRNNDLIKRDFGDLSGMDVIGNREIWTQAKLRTANQVVLFAMGTGGSVRGMNESLPSDIHRDYIGRDRRNRPMYSNTGSFRPDLMVFDDIVEMKWLKSKKVRDQVEEWLLTSALPALDAVTGNVIIVGTTLHDDDIVSRLYRDRVKTQAWLKMKKPACKGFDAHCNPIEPLWPSFWGLADENKPLNRIGMLMQWDEAQHRIKTQGGEGVYYLSHIWWKKIELGTKAFAQEYLLDPLSDGLKLIDRAWVRYYVTKNTVINSAQENAIMSAGIRLDALPTDLIAITSCDPASARGQRAIDNDSDYSVVSTIGYSPTMRRFYLLDIDRVRTTPAVLMQILLRHYMTYNHQYAGRMYTDKQRKNYIEGYPCEHLGIIVESVGYQKALAISLDELATALGMYPRIIEVKRGRSDKKVRATSASPLFENGQVYWPCVLLTDQLKGDFEDALEELDRFPEGAHDDCVDSVVDCLNFLNRMSLSLNRGLAAQVAMREMLKQSPELYAYVSKRETEDGVDMQDALNQFRQRN